MSESFSIRSSIDLSYLKDCKGKAGQQTRLRTKLVPERGPRDAANRGLASSAKTRSGSRRRTRVASGLSRAGRSCDAPGTVRTSPDRRGVRAYHSLCSWRVDTED